MDAQHVVLTIVYLNRFKDPKRLIEKRFEESGSIMYRYDYHGAIKIDFLKDKPIQINAWQHTKTRYWQD